MSTSARCSFPWCTTNHGEGIGADDEHRSIGVAVPLALRKTGQPATERTTTAEIGLCCRLDDAQIWVTVDDGEALRYDLSLPSIRAAIATLELDPLTLAALRPR